MIDPSRCVNCPELSSGIGPFGLHPDHIRFGWRWRTEQMEETGCTRHVLHLPHGHCTAFLFDMPAILTAAGGKLAELVPWFVPEMAWLNDHGHEVSVYVGQLAISPGMTALKGTGLKNAYYKRLAANLNLYREAGCPVVYHDASALVAKGTEEWDALQWQKRNGVEVGIEALPGATGVNGDHWAGHPVYVTERDYQEQIGRPGTLAKARMGPVIRTINCLPDAEKVAAYERILADGDTPGVDLLNLSPNLIAPVTQAGS